MAPEHQPRVSQDPDFYIPLSSDSLHDLASPLNQVCSIADLILRNCRAKMDADAEALFSLFENSTNRLQNLVAGLRTYAQVAGAASAYQLCGAEDLLSAALAIVAQRIGPHDACITHDPLPELWCNPAQIAFVLASLIENAIKFRSEAQPKIHLSARPAQIEWVIAVRDNGFGIDPRYFEKIFGMFKRLNGDHYPGAGVGLAIARQVAETHGGRIWVESEIGQGATFFIAMPRTGIQTAAR